MKAAMTTQYVSGSRASSGAFLLRAGALTLLLGAGLTLTPGDAQAKDEFETAFKYELGRIAAHEAVGVGRHVLAEVLLGTHGHHSRRYRDDDYGYDRHYGGSRHSYKSRKWHGGHPGWHRGHHRKHHDHHRWHGRHRGHRGHGHGHGHGHHGGGCDY